MAALDILQTVTPTPVSGTSLTVTFTALNPGDIVLFFRVGFGTSTTPPGVQSYDTGGDGVPWAFAKVVQAGDPLSWTFTSSISGRQIWVAHRIEGPFTDLSTLQVSTRTGSATVTAFRVPATNVSVSANTRVFAAITRNGSGAVAFSNGFATGGSNAWVESVATATRLYTAGATDVHTEATWATAAWPTAMLFRLQAPASPPVANSLVYGTQPQSTNVGSTMAPFTVAAVDSTKSDAIDTTYTGNITFAPTGAGNYAGTLTRAAVAGVATFNNIVPQTIGTGLSLTASASGLGTEVSATFNVTVPSGGGANLAYTEADMQQDVRALGDASQIGEVLILNTDGTPATGLAFNTAGLACHASTDGGAASAVTLATMTLGTYASGGFVQINATTRPGWYAFGYPTFPSSGRVRSFTFTGTGLRPATVRVAMTADDPYAASLTAEGIATEVREAIDAAPVEAELSAAGLTAVGGAVRDDAINQLLAGATFGESSIVLKDSTGADVTITVTRAARNAIASTT